MEKLFYFNLREKDAKYLMQYLARLALKLKNQQESSRLLRILAQLAESSSMGDDE